MTNYTYYSIMRPVGIGTFPGKPVKITNYPEGRKQINTADGQKLWAWGELEYAEPLDDTEVYGYELRGEYEYPEYHHRGWWMNDGVHEIIQLGRKYYVLDGWNGESYGHCWECLTQTKMADTDKEFTLTPIYFYETKAGQAKMNDPELADADSETYFDLVDKMNEIVSYRISQNC